MRSASLTDAYRTRSQIFAHQFLDHSPGTVAHEPSQAFIMESNSPTTASAQNIFTSATDYEAPKPTFFMPPMSDPEVYIHSSNNSSSTPSEEFHLLPAFSQDNTSMTRLAAPRPTMTIRTPAPDQLFAHWQESLATAGLSPSSDFGSDAGNSFAVPSPMTPESDTEWVGRGRGTNRRSPSAPRRPSISPYFRPRTIRNRSSSTSMTNALNSLHIDSRTRSQSRDSRSSSDISGSNGNLLQVPGMRYSGDVMPGYASSHEIEDDHFSSNGASSAEGSVIDEGMSCGTYRHSETTVRLEEVSPLLPDDDMQPQASYRKVGSEAIVKASVARRRKLAAFFCSVAGCSAEFTAKHNLNSKLPLL